MMMIPMEDSSNTMTFVSAELSSTMFQKLYEQKKANRFCDLTLHVNNKIIKAHRNVLACSSPYFDSILKHHKIIREQLIITCMDSDTFTTILNYMYTGEITIEHSNVEELLKLADHFIITKVIEYCIEFLGTKLNLDNCLFTYFLTQRFKLKHLGNIVENWIVSHIDEICDGEEIINLNANELGDFFKNKSFILSTARALNLLAEWTMHNNIKREHAFDKLIKCFDTNSLEPNQVFKHLDTHILYTKSDFCMYRFLDHLVQNNWMLSNFKARYDNLHLKYNAELIQQIENNSVKSAKIDNKIIVAEKNDSPTQQQNDFTSVLVKAKLRNKKQLILKRLMLFGLKPSLRMAALKMLTCNNKKKCLNLMEEDDEEGNADEELNDEDEEETEKKQDGVKCPICFQQINDTLLLEQHLALSHSKDVTYKCGICCYICQYHGDYLNHMKSHFTGPPYKCDYCDMNCDQIAKLISHRAQHLDEALFQCTFCSFKCRLKANFAAHLKIHTANLPSLPSSAQAEKLFKCDECTKSFRFKPNLESHKLSHTADESKNLTCDACGFHTKFLSHMIAHKRIHSSGEVYKCSFAHCKFSTAKKNQLAAHIKSNHHNNGSAAVRPHTCGVCGRGFMEKSHLVRHERIHLEEKPFKCSNCDYASSRRDKLKEHFTRHHGENASAKVPYKARPMRTNSSNNNRKVQQETVVATTSSNFSASSTTTSTSTSVSSQPLGNEIQDLIMHHQSAAVAAINSNYHHFGEASADFHHHHHHHGHHHHHYNHNLVHNQLLSNGQRSNVLNNNNNGGNSGGSNQISNSNGNLANHHMLSRSNHSTATSTAAAVAAAMMLDPRFHHNSTPYHGASTAAMAAVQQTSQQQVQGAAEYSTSLQNCMTLF